MAKKFLTIILITLFISFAPPAFAFSIDGGGVCSCGDISLGSADAQCTDCTSALNYAGCTTINLVSDITNKTGQCITFSVNQKTFDCYGHTIDGDDVGQDYGVYSYEYKKNQTIKNCIITDFYYGILLQGLAGGSISNNIANSNRRGIYLQTASGLSVTGNTTNLNSQYGIDLQFSANDNVISGNVANYNYYGFHLDGATRNIFSGNVANFNTSGGYYLGFAGATFSNTLKTSTACNNSYSAGSYDVIGAGRYYGENNICRKTSGWHDDGTTTGCKYFLPNVDGWAWSENIGWISFGNCSSIYGVNIEDDGTMSGYAWSENIGWISFNSTELSGCPSGVCKAIVNLDTGEVSGWARACAGTVNGDCTGATRTDGWDGWIKLDGVSVNKTTGDFSGWAWGGDVVGWIHFADALYKVRTYFDFNRTPTITITKDPNSAKSFCGVDPNNKDEGLVGFEWNYDDADNDSQAQYQTQIATDSSFVNKVVDCTIPQVVSSGGTGTASATVAPSPSTNCSSAHLEIPYGGEGNWYYWRVKVQDARGKWSGASGQPGVQFDTPTHAKPWPDFLCNGVDCSTIKPFLGQTIQFTDASQLFGGASFSSWAWTFENGDPANSAIQNPPLVKFSIAGSGSKNGIGLTVTDNKPYSCSVSKSIKFYTSSPKWRGAHL